MKKDNENWLENRLKYFQTMESFENEDDIPELPIVDVEIYNNIIIPNLIRCGAIPKDKLVVGKEYLGSCRNTTRAFWNGNCFFYKRYKWGSYYEDEINHFQDDDGYDLFIPIKEI